MAFRGESSHFLRIDQVNRGWQGWFFALNGERVLNQDRVGLDRPIAVENEQTGQFCTVLAPGAAVHRSFRPEQPPEDAEGAGWRIGVVFDEAMASFGRKKAQEQGLKEFNFGTFQWNLLNEKPFGATV